LVKSWNPDFIVSVGDNNYYEGKFTTLKSNITNYYGDYIYNYDAPDFFRCNGKAFEEKINRFFPTPGNHDANNRDGLIPYYNYFTLPHNEIYYKFSWGPVTFYSINTVETNLEEQKSWLQDALLNSTSPFNIIFLHHPPFSSGGHGNNEFIQWDFFNMGADIVFAGHDHIYERSEKLNEEGMFYIVNGLGGRAYSDCNVHAFSGTMQNMFCYGNDYGAVKGTATSDKLIIEFFAVGAPDVPVDRFEIVK
jgi:3',5'-cyclic AMP phosphodiesterase CpdA